MSGKFTINQSGKPFSNIGIDQAHEQNNKLVKIDGGAVDILLTDNSALTKWMVAGPEIADMVNSFRLTENEDKKMKHHEDTISFEKRFRKDVQAFSSTMRELGNPFAQTDNNFPVGTETSNGRPEDVHLGRGDVPNGRHRDVPGM